MNLDPNHIWAPVGLISSSRRRGARSFLNADWLRKLRRLVSLELRRARTENGQELTTPIAVGTLRRMTGRDFTQPPANSADRTLLHPRLPA